MSTFTVVKVDDGLTAYKVNHCKLCGWYGNAQFAHNDYQAWNLIEERKGHVCPKTDEGKE